MTGLCDAVGFTPQAFYKAKKQRQRKQLEEDRILAVVAEKRCVHPRRGGRKLLLDLEAAGVEIGRDKLFDFLRDKDLLVPPAPKKARTTNSRHCLPTFANRIADLEVTRPHQVWVSDLTYVRVNNSFVYLALTMDLYSRKIVGWHCSNSLEAEGCMQALRMALKQLPKGKKPIHHSDRGTQYCCHAYVDLLRDNGLEISMTEKNHCYENAHAERLNGILKQEYWLGSTFRSQAQAKIAVAQAVAAYNTDRPHTSLQYATPEKVHAASA